MTSRLRFLVPFVAVVSLVPLAGCAALDANEVAADEAVGRTRAALQVQGAPELSHIGLAFQDVPLAKNERTELQKMLDDATVRRAPLKQARAAAAEALASEIEAGKIDHPTLDPLFASVDKEVESLAKLDRAAITRAHDILDEGQRKALVDAIRDEVGDKKEGMRAHGKEIAEQLELTDDQKSKLKAIAISRFASKGFGFKGKGHGSRMLDAFLEDKLDLDAVAPESEIQAKRIEGRESFIGAAEEFLPELTPAQRQKAATLIREKADALFGR